MFIHISSIVSAFSMRTIGTKVSHKATFMDALRDALRGYTFPESGHGIVDLDCLDAVSCGVARRKYAPLPGYVAREHRGEVILCASRLYASKPTALRAVVYTAKAYCSDPQVGDAERKVVEETGATHVLVAVLASAGEGRPPVSAHRFVRNLAGGNASYWPDNGYTLEAAIQEARAILAYEEEWIVVAD